MADVSITASQVLQGATAQTVTGLAAAAVTAGQIVYKDVAGKFGLADANAATPIYKAYGVALNSAAANQPLTVAVSDPVLTLGAAATLTIGDTYILSGTTPGSFALDSDAVSGWRKQVCGVALSASTLYLKFVNSDTALA